MFFVQSPFCGSHRRRMRNTFTFFNYSMVSDYRPYQGFMLREWELPGIIHPATPAGYMISFKLITSRHYPFPRAICAIAYELSA
jgi:hypothetical protein